MTDHRYVFPLCPAHDIMRSFTRSVYLLRAVFSFCHEIFHLLRNVSDFVSDRVISIAAILPVNEGHYTVHMTSRDRVEMVYIERVSDSCRRECTGISLTDTGALAGVVH